MWSINKRPLNHPNSIELSRQRKEGEKQEKQEQKRRHFGLPMGKFTPQNLVPKITFLLYSY